MNHADDDPPYKIEKDIPIPEPRNRGNHTLASALRAMEVGDSILIVDRAKENVSAQCSQLGRMINRKYTTRNLGVGVRVWRVE